MDDVRLALAHRLPRPLAYVLGGGGAYGAVQMGMLRALALTDLRPDLVVGTSVGSINGAVVAADPEGAAADLVDTFREVLAQASVPVVVVAGGARRQDSVAHGLDAAGADGIVLVHDAARPFVPSTVVADERIFAPQPLARCMSSFEGSPK